MLNRLPDWRHRLDALLIERQRTPFSWGTQDCCLFAADAVLAVTGTDPAEAWRGAYSDLRGAAELLAGHGGVEGFATAALGAPLGPLYAQVGDVVLVRTREPGMPEGEEEGRPSLAVCIGDVAMATGADGLVALRMDRWLAAWRVGA